MSCNCNVCCSCKQAETQWLYELRETPFHRHLIHSVSFYYRVLSVVLFVPLDFYQVWESDISSLRCWCKPFSVWPLLLSSLVVKVWNIIMLYQSSIHVAALQQDVENMDGRSRRVESRNGGHEDNLVEWQDDVVNPWHSLMHYHGSLPLFFALCTSFRCGWDLAVGGETSCPIVIGWCVEQATSLCVGVTQMSWNGITCLRYKRRTVGEPFYERDSILTVNPFFRTIFKFNSSRLTRSFKISDTVHGRAPNVDVLLFMAPGRQKSLDNDYLHTIRNTRTYLSKYQVCIEIYVHL